MVGSFLLRALGWPIFRAKKWLTVRFREGTSNIPPITSFQVAMKTLAHLTRLKVPNLHLFYGGNGVLSHHLSLVGKIPHVNSLKLTAILPLKVGRLPQKEMNHLNQASTFRGENVSFREGTGFQKQPKGGFSRRISEPTVHRDLEFPLASNYWQKGCESRVSGWIVSRGNINVVRYCHFLLMRKHSKFYASLAVVCGSAGHAGRPVHVDPIWWMLRNNLGSCHTGWLSKYEIMPGSPCKSCQSPIIEGVFFVK